MADRFILYDLILYKMVINVNFCFIKKIFVSLIVTDSEGLGIGDKLPIYF